LKADLFVRPAIGVYENRCRTGLAGSILVAAGIACFVASFRIKKKF
jgi:hypothetical protein